MKRLVLRAAYTFAIAFAVACLAAEVSAQPAPPPADPPPAGDAPAAPKPAAGDIEEARARMEKGQRLFADTKYTEATDEFALAYERHRFSAFLFNAAVAAERAGSRDRSVELYEKFLKSEPSAPDRAQIEATIERLKKEQGGAPPEPSSASHRTDIKALVFVESEPLGAPISIYERTDPKALLFDPKKEGVQPGYKRVLAGITAPTNLSLAQGTYFILVEGFRDYNPTGSQFIFDPGRVYVYRASLSQGDFVGRVEIAVPVSSAKIYVDDPPPHKNAPRAVGPNSFELTPGTHKLYIEAPGFEPYQKSIHVVQGKTTKVDAQLERVAYGYLLVSGNAEEVELEVNGEDVGIYLKKKGEPLRVRVPAGEHEIEVDAPGRKSYETVLKIPKGQEIALDAKLEEAPSKGGAIVTTILTAGTLAGGIVLFRFVQDLPDDDGLKEPLHAVSIGLMAGAGAFAGLSIFLFVYDPGEDSSAKVTPAREFTGEAEQPAVKPKPVAAGPRIQFGVSALPVAPPSGSSPLAPMAPTGLVVGGRF